MADGDSLSGDAETWQRTRDARNIRELFRGRLTDDESSRLLRYFEWDRDRTVSHILNAGPGELSQLLNIDGLENRTDFVTRDNVLSDLAKRNEIGHSVRQFACQGCDKMWRRRTPNRKPVSRCNRCKRKYEPIPRDQEWGWAEFECECGNTFAGTGHMGRTQSICYQCRTLCSPTKIVPPFKKGDPRRRSDRPHSCSGENCFNRQVKENYRSNTQRQGYASHIDPDGNRTTYIGSSFSQSQQTRKRRGNQAKESLEYVAVTQEYPNREAQRGRGHPGQKCMHPKSLPRVVQVPSQPHVSTGSTVNTFLNQDDIEPPYEPSLCGIPDVSD